VVRQRLDIAKAQSRIAIGWQKHSARHAAWSHHIPDDWHHPELSCHHDRVPSRSEFVQQSAIDSIIYLQYKTLQHSHLDHDQSADLFLHSREVWHPNSDCLHLILNPLGIELFAGRQRPEEDVFDLSLQTGML